MVDKELKIGTEMEDDWWDLLLLQNSRIYRKTLKIQSSDFFLFLEVAYFDERPEGKFSAFLKSFRYSFSAEYSALIFLFDPHKTP